MMYLPLFAAVAATAAEPPLPIQEFRGVWVATVDNIDWPSKPGLPVETQKKELDAIVAKVAELKLNAIVFQIRPHGDALYESKIEPWSYYLTGAQGKAPSPRWDPLKHIVEAAHERGIELHVWFNPYRAKHPAQKAPLSSDHIAVTHPDVVHDYGQYKWMDPGSKIVQDRSFNVFMDVVDRYDVDGIHIDDYFYPYPIRNEAGATIPFPDSKTYGAYKSNGGSLSLSAWRRHNVDTFVERVYKGLKQRKPWVKFGISPFGIYRPGIPTGIAAGIDQYEELSADALRWYREGWCDYFTPQLYWPIAQTKQSFPVLLNYWRSENPKKIHLWPGLYTGRTNPKDGNWNPDEVVNQVELIRKGHGGTPGHVHFSMKAFMLNFNNVANILKPSLYTEPAVMPASPWLSKKSVAPVDKLAVSRKNADWTCDWAPVSTARFYTVQARRGDKWSTVQSGTSTTVTVPNTVDEVAVRVSDKFGTLSPAVIAKRPLPQAGS